ncbi:MAG: phosphoribosylformylglycinamidine synthase [Flavobacteriales bacterium]|nr:phosphoribosylformylglycinamidine synthase [Flavobacteriales bacterium]
MVNERLDSLFIDEVENQPGERPKVLHAEPLYIDLIRDLGARRGEREWNLGFGITDHLGYDVYEMLIEYEWAPIDRLGLEIETPFRFHGQQRNGAYFGDVVKPVDRMESLKLAAQWTFLVDERRSTSLALGYLNELEFSAFDSFGQPLFTGNLYNPFFIAAKRWGSNFHSLLYTGPRILRHFEEGATHVRYDINANLHYMITGTRNFVGIETNMAVEQGDFDMTLRPQMRVGIAENFLVGIVAGIPVARESERFSMFTRIIWEPAHRKGH